MNARWMMVVVAAIFEVVWVSGLKHADSIAAWVGTAVALLISFRLMLSAGKQLPVGTVYAVFVGLGTAGTVLAEMLVYGAPFAPVKLALIAILLAGVAGLKRMTPDSARNEDKEGERS
ncbi:MAG: multidrug efflux SMR transporter [Paenibacillaceae bacterium]|nr:multidrug efflux SMR transporter [Paenibacillaceae bacterium]